MTDYDNHLSEQDISALVGGGFDRDTYLLLCILRIAGNVWTVISTRCRNACRNPPDGLNESILSRLKTSIRRPPVHK